MDCVYPKASCWYWCACCPSITWTHSVCIYWMIIWLRHVSPTRTCFSNSDVFLQLGRVSPTRMCFSNSDMFLQRVFLFLPSLSILCKFCFFPPTTISTPCCPPPIWKHCHPTLPVAISTNEPKKIPGLRRRTSRTTKSNLRKTNTGSKWAQNSTVVSYTH